MQLCGLVVPNEDLKGFYGGGGVVVAVAKELRAKTNHWKNYIKLN